MKKVILSVFAVPFILAPAVMLAQGMASKGATYITDEEVKAVNALPGVDRTIRVVDVGPENFAVGIIHRGSTTAPAPAAAARPAGAAPAAPPAGTQPCGTADANAPKDLAGGLYHNKQTEGYYIVSGEGMIVTGGHIVNGRTSAPDAEVTTTLNGPSCSGRMAGNDVVKRMVKTGDIVIIPAGVPHGWAEIKEHVDYLSFRPSGDILTVGYKNPALK